MALDTTIALVTMDEAKEFIKKTDDTNITTLELIVNSVCEFIRGYTGRTLPSTVYTSLLLDGSGWPDMWLPNWPVTTLTSLYENDTLLTKDTDFYIYEETGKLTRIASAWPSELGIWTERPKGIKITYTAGYSAAAMPKDLKTACLIQTADYWTKFLHNSWGESTRSVASQSVTVIEGDILPVVKATLARYRRTRG